MLVTSTGLLAETVSSQLHKFRVVPLAKGLEHPWSIAFLPNKSILISERAGRLRLYQNGRLDAKPVGNLPKIVDSGQGGLFDVTLHPDFRKNQLLYLAYAARGQGGVHTRVTRYRYDAKVHALADARQIFDASPKASGGRHFGGRMVFDRQGYLYITLGDRGDMDRAQDTAEHSGSVIRLHDDGRVPSDNPLRAIARAKPEIYSFGHRNPQGMALYPKTGAIWTHEHGARGGDEINIIRPGRNYGWPVITHGINYDGSKIGIGKSAPGMEQPLYYWVPSIAPAGMAFYAGNRVPEMGATACLSGRCAARHWCGLNSKETKPLERKGSSKARSAASATYGPALMAFFTSPQTTATGVCCVWSQLGKQRPLVEHILREEVFEIDAVEVFRHRAGETLSLIRSADSRHGGIDQPLGAHPFELMAAFRNRRHLIQSKGTRVRDHRDVIGCVYPRGHGPHHLP